jgi:tetratricopeptide (TPR) repeat protein
LGEEHPDVAALLNNLAVSLKAQGKYDEAEPLYRQSLAIIRKVCAIHLVASSRDHSCQVLGEEHPDVAQSLNNLAELLKAQGKYDEAEPLCRQSLAIIRKVCAIRLAASSRDHSCQVLGEEHPYVATFLNNLAGSLKAQGKYDEALIYANQSLDINKRVLGNEHPSTLTSIACVAGNLQAKGDYAAAEPFLRQVISGKSRILGNEHPEMASALNNLAGLLKNTGRSEVAHLCGWLALAIATRALGPNHPITKQLRKNWA